MLMSMFLSSEPITSGRYLNLNTFIYFTWNAIRSDISMFFLSYQRGPTGGGNFLAALGVDIEMVSSSDRLNVADDGMCMSLPWIHFYVGEPILHLFWTLQRRKSSNITLSTRHLKGFGHRNCTFTSTYRCPWSMCPTSGHVWAFQPKRKNHSYG